MATATVKDVQTQAVNTSNTLTSQAVNQLDNILNYLNGVNIDYNAYVPDQPALNGIDQANFLRAVADARVPAAPALPDATSITAPTRGVLSAYTTPDIGNIPTFDLVLPTITLPAKPSTTLPTAPGDAPAFNAPAIPDSPVFSLPDVPTFTPVAIPDAVSVDLPSFTASDDFGDITAPTSTFQWSESAYQSALLDAVKAELMDSIINGGYGINVNDERMLWDRARERELINANFAISEAARIIAARGFSIPPAALHAQERELQQDLFNKNSTLSRDIAIKRADQFVENRKFTIQQSTEVEQMMITYYGAMAERALNAARAQVELEVAIFQTQVAAFSARLEKYKTYAQVFESRIRAALATMEIYKARVEGARLSVEIQKLYADVYATQLEGVKTLVDVYKTQMEAAQIGASIEAVKLQGFKAKVDAYAVQVRAKVSEFDMFEAQIRGELSKVQIYQASVGAYTAQLGGVEAKARIAETKARVEIAQNASTIDSYSADVQAYRAKIEAANDNLRGVLGKYSGQLQAYATYMNSYEKAAQVNMSQNDAAVRNFLTQQSMIGERLKASTDTYLKMVEVVSGRYQGAAQIQSSLASSWVSTVNGITAEISS